MLPVAIRVSDLQNKKPSVSKKVFGEEEGIILRTPRDYFTRTSGSVASCFHNNQ